MRSKMLSMSFVLAATALPGFNSRAEVQLTNPEFEKALPNEEQLYSQIAKGILFIQKQQAQHSKNGKLLRGTHAKGICVDGTMEIKDVKSLYSGDQSEIGEKLAVGLFSQSGSYPTRVRFANAAGEILRDQLPDVRAVSFSVRDVPEYLSNQNHRVDILMNDKAVFPINDAQVFADVMVARQEQVSLENNRFVSRLPEVLSKYALPAALLIKIGPERAKKLSEAKDVGEQQKQPLSKAFQSTVFWSTTPWALGTENAVKYSLVPCAKNDNQDVTKSRDENILQTELKRALTNPDKPELCFDLKVQLLNVDKMTDVKTGGKHSKQEWIENALLEWSEEQAPAYTVGRLQLNKNGLVDAETCERERMDPIHNTHPDQKGLGSINRARSHAESESANKRGAADSK